MEGAALQIPAYLLRQMRLWVGRVAGSRGVCGGGTVKFVENGETSSECSPGPSSSSGTSLKTSNIVSAIAMLLALFDKGAQIEKNITDLHKNVWE